MKRLLSSVGGDSTRITVMKAIIKTQGELIDTLGNGESLENINKPTSTLNPDGKSRSCTCGARHTSFPNHHMRYCDMR